METTKQIKVALYSRVSSDEQAAEGVSIPAQKETLANYAAAMKWEVFDEYVDGGYSGGTDDRPALKRLIRDAREKRFDVVAVCKLDRFFRELRLLLNCLYDFEQLGIKFIAVQEGLDTSNPYGKFAVQIMGVIAEFEKGRIGERVKDARKHLISRGDWPGGKTPYGIRWDAETRTFSLDPKEAEVVRKIYSLYVEDKAGTVKIAELLNDEGFLTRRGRAWNENKVRGILIHEAYKGTHPWGIKMPAIVDEATWQKAQDRRETARNVRKDPGSWLLQGMVFCGHDGHAMKCIRKRNNAPAYYACRARVGNKYDGGNKCSLPYVRADLLETAVWGKLKEVLSHKDKLRDAVDKALSDLEARKERTGADVLAVDEKLDDVRARKERLGVAFADMAIGEDRYKEILARLNEQETGHLRRRSGIDPSRMEDLIALEAHIIEVKEFLKVGEFVVRDSGLYAVSSDRYLPLGFNAFRSSDEKLALGDIQPREFTTSHVDYPIPPEAIGLPPTWTQFSPGTISVHTFSDNVDPEELNDCDDQEKATAVIRNKRALLQLFDIKVFVHDNGAEIKGTIPPQFIDLKNLKPKHIAPVLATGRGTEGVVDFP